MYAIAVHGGAGKWLSDSESSVLDGVRHATEIGQLILLQGGTALDAVVSVVVELENNPIFNAGTGSAFNVDGEAEMDAGVMMGQGLQTGNVACIRRVKNPILVARKVMEETDHVLLAGEGVLRFARDMGFEDYDPVTPFRVDDYLKKRQKMLDDAGSMAYLRNILRSQAEEHAKGTVGCVVLDVHGGLAAATSTGGVTMKLAGRIGDSPIPGAGNYATSSAAASATGQGEMMMRILTTKSVCDLVRGGWTAEKAVKEVLARMATEVGTGAGIIAVDANGVIGIAHLTQDMPHAYVSNGQKDIVAAMHV